KAIDVHDSLGKRLRRFLWQIVPDATTDGPVLVYAREFLGITTRVRVRSTIGVALERDGRDGDHRSVGKLLFQLVVFRLAFSQSEPPAIVVDDDRNVVGIVERRGTAIEGGIVEIPLRRGEVPDEFVEIVPVPVVAGAAAFGGEVVL